jgi:hypothetical protein
MIRAPQPRPSWVEAETKLKCYGVLFFCRLQPAGPEQNSAGRKAYFFAALTFAHRARAAAAIFARPAALILRRFLGAGFLPAALAPDSFASSVWSF